MSQKLFKEAFDIDRFEVLIACKRESWNYRPMWYWMWEHIEFIESLK